MVGKVCELCVNLYKRAAYPALLESRQSHRQLVFLLWRCRCCLPLRRQALLGRRAHLRAEVNPDLVQHLQQSGGAKVCERSQCRPVQQVDGGRAVPSCSDAPLPRGHPPRLPWPLIPRMPPTPAPTLPVHRSADPVPSTFAAPALVAPTCAITSSVSSSTPSPSSASSRAESIISPVISILAFSRLRVGREAGDTRGCSLQQLEQGEAAAFAQACRSKESNEGLTSQR